jgi:Protein of unknown function (DUF1769)
MVMNSEASSPTTTSMLSLLKGMWEVEQATPPSSPTQRPSAVVRISSYPQDNWGIRSNESYEGSGGVNDKTEAEVSSAEDQVLRMQLVENRLLNIVADQQAGEERYEVFQFNEFDQPSLKSPIKVLPIYLPHAYPCADSNKLLPSSPLCWPQSPLMLRPTPNSQMKIRGVRYANSTVYQEFPGICAGCILPINTGCELPGQSLVIDFESSLFVGTLLMRVKGAPAIGPAKSATGTIFVPTSPTADAATKPTASRATPSYFDGKKRQFQVVIKGRFKQENIPMSECATGQVFDRPAGKLPARFMVNAFVKFISTLAPQLEVELDGHRPRFLSPLVATAHTVISKEHSAIEVSNSSDCSMATIMPTKKVSQEDLVNFSCYAGSATMEDDVEEPSSDDPSSVIMALPLPMKGIHGSPGTVAQRRAVRKKAFNRLAANGSVEPVFDTNKEYTFEFYQHLLLLSEPDDFKIDMGHHIHVGLARSLNGQPIKILGTRMQRSSLASGETSELNGNRMAQVLWSFDLWHQALYPYAVSALEKPK